MVECESRLVSCFRAVFPYLDEKGARGATVSSIPEWDSVATVTLITVVEEEFGISVEVDDVDQMVSFDRLLGYVQAKTERSVK
jgi:hypothetical protein